MRPRSLALMAMVCSLAGALGCTEALLQPEAVKESTLDDRLAIRGKVCTAAPDPTGFPVKIVFLIDKSGSMCVSDGPGSQNSGGFCETVGAAYSAKGITEPGRVRAMRTLLDRFSKQSNVSVALVPFESKISSDKPKAEGFLPANGFNDQDLRNLQADLGKGTDYQGALAHAQNRIENDIKAQMARGGRAQLPRTKYVVILLTDGTPYPRCTSNDADANPSVYSSPDRPEGIWRDNPASFCNASNTEETIPEFRGGTDRNQNYQIFDAADRLMSLREKYNVGDIRLHTILLFNQDAVQLCGQICLTDLYNGMPTPEAARQVAKWTLTELATKHGGGTFQEFTDMATIELGSLDYSSLASRFVQKTLLVSNVHAAPDLDGPVVDSDGDNVIDDQDAAKVLGTSQLNIDTDGDGFPDAFELSHKQQGFDALTVDPRGCKNGTTFQAKYSCADTDGDGVSQAMEVYLGTDPILPDTDADGMLDGLEARLGLDPLVPNNRLLDRDLDGIPDVLEVLAHTNPVLDDRAVHARDSYRYQVTGVAQENGSMCYDYLVSNIRLVTPDAANGQHGYNFITLTFAEAPEGGVSRDYGAWKQACVYAQFAPPSVRMPEGPEITLEPGDFRRLDSINRTPGTLVPTNPRGVCKGFVP